MFDVKNLIGLTEENAVAKIKTSGFKVRVRMRDGQSFVGTCDARKDRVNLYIEKGLITKASIG
jgi:hypothetical protein